MRLLNEVIAELTHVEQVYKLDPVDARFILPGTDTRGGTDDPDDFCDECKVLGFCKVAHPDMYEEHLEKIKKELILKNGE